MTERSASFSQTNATMGRSPSRKRLATSDECVEGPCLKRMKSQRIERAGQAIDDEEDAIACDLDTSATAIELSPTRSADDASDQSLDSIQSGGNRESTQDGDHVSSSSLGIYSVSSSCDAAEAANEAGAGPSVERQTATRSASPSTVPHTKVVDGSNVQTTSTATAAYVDADTIDVVECNRRALLHLKCGRTKNDGAICLVCVNGRRYSNRDHAIRHWREVHANLRYKCRQSGCESLFKRPENRRKHELDDHNLILVDSVPSKFAVHDNTDSGEKAPTRRKLYTSSASTPAQNWTDFNQYDELRSEDSVGLVENDAADESYVGEDLVVSTRRRSSCNGPRRSAPTTQHASRIDESIRDFCLNSEELALNYAFFDDGPVGDIYRGDDGDKLYAAKNKSHSELGAEFLRGGRYCCPREECFNSYSRYSS